MADLKMFPAKLPVLHDGVPAGWEDLPPTLLTNILSRLPVKTLIISTSVNKSWYAFIKNPNFISEHINHSISSNASKNGDKFSLITPTALATPPNWCSLISDKSGVEVSKFEIPFSTKHGSIMIVGSCNGLVCLTENIQPYYGRDVYLWNPSVRRYKKLGKSCYPEVTNHSNNVFSTMPVLGYGYHKPSNDYKVVRIIYGVDAYYGHSGSLDPKVEIFSLRSGSWRRIKTRVPDIVDHYRSLCENGCIYWMKMSDPNKGPPPYESVISFDLDVEVFREIKLPRSIRHGFKVGSYNQTLMNFQGSVGVLAFGMAEKNWGLDNCQSCSLWILREDGSWTRKKKFVLPIQLTGVPVKFSMAGNLIIEGPLLTATLGFRKLCALKMPSFEVVQELGSDGPYTVDADFVESLVLL